MAACIISHPGPSLSGPNLSFMISNCAFKPSVNLLLSPEGEGIAVNALTREIWVSCISFARGESQVRGAKV